MILFFGYSTDCIDERERLRKVGKLPRFLDFFCVVRQSPPLELREEHCRLIFGERRRTSLARYALFSGQIHDLTLARAYNALMKKLLGVILDGLSGIIDIILPLKARSARLQSATLEDIALSPTSHDLLGVRITTLMDYKEQTAQDLIQSLKYDGGGRAARLLASIVSEYLVEEIAGDKIFSTKNILLVPLPLHASRKRERGFNQIEAVLERLPQEFRDGTKSLLGSDILIRTRATQPQTRLHRSERLSNVAGAFSLRDGVDVSKAHVYLIDDVTTTGATLANAATPLRRAGASVHLIALARA